jgi:Ca-activated chloride channel family protein
MNFRFVAGQLSVSPRKLPLLMYLTFFAGGLTPATAQQFAQGVSQTTIHVNVNLVSVGVTVTDAHGNFVRGLRGRDFRLYDNGTEQHVTNFASLDEPATVVLMMECGPAALFTRKSELQGASSLISALRPADRLALVTYSDKPTLLLDFTSNKSEVRSTLQAINFMAGSTQLNLASAVAATLDWLTSIPGKKTIVLLSSGVHTSTEADWVAAQRQITASDVRILAASVAMDIRQSEKRKKLSVGERDERKHLKQEFLEADRVLRMLTNATGGRVYFPKNTKDAQRAYSEIAQYLSCEYSLAFAPTSHDGLVHSLAVKTNNSWHHVSYRSAYIAPSRIDVSP